MQDEECIDVDEYRLAKAEIFSYIIFIYVKNIIVVDHLKCTIFSKFWSVTRGRYTWTPDRGSI